MWCCQKCGWYEMRISISKLRVVRALCCAVCYEAWAVILEQMGLIHRYGCHHSHVMKGSMKWYENTTQLKCQSSFDFLWHQTGHANLSHNESFNTSCYYGFMFFFYHRLVWSEITTQPILSPQSTFWSKCWNLLQTELNQLWWIHIIWWPFREYWGPLGNH